MLAFVLSGLVLAGISGFSFFNWPFSLSAAIGTFLAVMICLRFYQKAPKKDSTGIGWGIIAGLLSLYLMSFFIALGFAFLSDAKVMGLLFSPFLALLMMVYAFVAGGFMAPIIGGYLGNRLAKYLDA